VRFSIIILFCFTFLSFEILAQDPYTYSWRYYRPGNTGIQGDQATALWIDENGDPYIAANTGNWGEEDLQSLFSLRTNGSITQMLTIQY